MKGFDKNMINITQSDEFIFDDSKKPKVFIPGNGVSIAETCVGLARAFSLAPDPARHLYSFRGVVSFIRDEDPENLSVSALSAKQACSEFERVAEIWEKEKRKDQGIDKPSICTRQFAELILSSRDFLALLPKLTMVTRFPVLYSSLDGGVRLIESYDDESGIFASNRPLEDMSLETALSVLNSVLKDFDFCTPGDRSRAFAALITPALIFGKFLTGRIPLTMIMADKSQAGKGFLADVICAVYGEVPGLVTQRRGGIVGNFDETFDAVLRTGRPFVLMDNLRGSLNSSQIEAFVTGENYQTRIAREGYLQVNPRDYFLLATSNGVEMTEDIINRSSFVALKKHDADYDYQEYPEGDLLCHIRANPMHYLSAVYCVIREWEQRGKPRGDGKEHSFREWVAVLDGIVQQVMGEAPLMQGIAEQKLKSRFPEIDWLNSVYQGIVKAGLTQTDLFAQDIVETCVEHEIPLSDGIVLPYETMTEGQRKQVCSLVSRRLSHFLGIQGKVGRVDCGEFQLIRGRKTRKFEGSSTIAVFFKFLPNKVDQR